MITVETASQLQEKSVQSRKRGNPGTFSQIVGLQQELANQVKGSDVTATAKAACANAFVNLEMLKRLMRGKPGLKPIDVDPDKGKGALIDLKLYNPRRRKLIELESKSPGPKTVITSSDYYKAQLPAACGPNTPTSSVPDAAQSQTSPQEQKPLNGS